MTGSPEFPTYAPDNGFYRVLKGRVTEYFEKSGYDSKNPWPGEESQSRGGQPPPRSLQVCTAVFPCILRLALTYTPRRRAYLLLVHH